MQDLIPLLEIILQLFALDFALAVIGPGSLGAESPLPGELEQEAHRGLPLLVYQVRFALGVDRVTSDWRPQNCLGALGRWHVTTTDWANSHYHDTHQAAQSAPKDLFSTLRYFSDKTATGVAGCNMALACIALHYFLKASYALVFLMLFLN